MSLAPAPECETAMEESIDHRPQRGRLTRWVFGEEGERTAPVRAELPTAAADVIDVRTEPPADLDILALRIERLETGLRLMADAMKRAYGDLSNSIRTLTYEIRDDPGDSTEGTNLHQSVASLNLMIDELLHSMRAFPHVLAAATDELSQRIEAVETRTTETVGELLNRREEPVGTTGASSNGG